MSSRVINVENCGALSNGTDPARTTTAVEGAINELTRQQGGVLYFPAGTYVLRIPITVDNVPCTIKGDGSGVTRIIWEASGGGIKFSGGSFSGNEVNSLHVSDVALISQPALNDAAISMAWDLGNLSVIPHYLIENVQIKGSDLYAAQVKSGWAVGIKAIGAYNSTIRNVQIFSPAGLSEVEKLGTRGIVLSSAPGHTTRATQCVASNVYCLNHHVGIELIDFEGLYLSGFELVFNNYGIKASNVYVALINNGHIDYRATGVQFDGCGAVRLLGCALKHPANHDGNGCEINSSEDIVIGNCSFYGPRGTGHRGNGVAIAAYATKEHAIVSGCVFNQFPDRAVWLRSGTRSNRVENNLYFNIDGNPPVLDQGTGNVVTDNVEG